MAIPIEKSVARRPLGFSHGGERVKFVLVVITARMVAACWLIG
jgi:hypothetical protein